MNEELLISPEAAASIVRSFQDTSAAMVRGVRIQIEQHRRDLNDELDWIGEWRGRRG